jgi:hypothetical protein
LLTGKQKTINKISRTMKNVTVILFCLLIIGACKKKEAIPKNNYAQYNGTITAIRNGKEWKPFIGAFYTGNNINNTFYIDIVDNHDNFEWDGISFNNIPSKVGVYECIDYYDWLKSTDSVDLMSATAFYNGSFNEGSDVGGRNTIRTDRPHRITIEYYNAATHEIRGSFEVSFMRSDTSRSRKLGLLDTVTYSNATFSATIWNPDEMPK